MVVVAVVVGCRWPGSQEVDPRPLAGAVNQRKSHHFPWYYFPQSPVPAERVVKMMMMVFVVVVVVVEMAARIRMRSQDVPPYHAHRSPLGVM